MTIPRAMQGTLVARGVQNYEANREAYRAMFQFGLCMGLVYWCDGPRHGGWILPTLKSYSRDLFLFVHVVLLAVSYLTLQKEARDNNNLCGRHFTEEWKGVMQIVFVLYHYFDAAEVYNLIRVFIAAYVWMTGFGNTAFFLKTNVYSAVRLVGMLFRLNWLVLWVCLLLDQPLMLYYICPLHTFFFVMVYVTWGAAYQLNATLRGKTLKLALCLAFLVCLFEIDGAFELFWSPFAAVFPAVFKLHGTTYEWQFRTRLDHYAAWFGMVFCCAYAWCNRKLQQIEGLASKRHVLMVKACLALLTLAALAAWYGWVYCHDKYTYNGMHPYTSFVPIFSYLILRNLSFAGRQYFSHFLIWMGQTTLETYIFQYHLYMVDDAKSILTLTVLEGYPLVNFLAVSVIYVYVSRVAFLSTNTLRNYWFPVNRDPDCPYKNNRYTLILTGKYLAVLVSLYLFSALIKLVFF